MINFHRLRDFPSTLAIPPLYYFLPYYYNSIVPNLTLEVRSCIFALFGFLEADYRANPPTRGGVSHWTCLAGRSQGKSPHCWNWVFILTHCCPEQPHCTQILALWFANSVTFSKLSNLFSGFLTPIMQISMVLTVLEELTYIKWVINSCWFFFFFKNLEQFLAHGRHSRNVTLY